MNTNDCLELRNSAGSMFARRDGDHLKLWIRRTATGSDRVREISERRLELLARRDEIRRVPCNETPFGAVGSSR